MITNSSVSQSAPGMRKTQAELEHQKSSALFHAVGYFLLLIGILEIFYVLMPPQLGNLVWRFQAVGAIVERSPLLLIGLVLAFYGGKEARSQTGRMLANLFSWFSLALGLGFVAMSLVGLLTTKSLYEQGISQLDTAFDNEMAQVAQFEERLNTLSDQELSQVLEKQGISQEQVSVSQARENAIVRLMMAKEDGQVKLDEQKSRQQRSLMKRAIKLNLGAILYGVVYIYIWKLTEWTRRR